MDKKHQYLGDFRCDVPLPPGWYDAQAFDNEGWCLGIRMVARASE